MALDLDYFKNKLEENKKSLEVQLSQIGRRNPQNSKDWEAMPLEADQNVRIAEQSELADAFEEFQNRSAIESHLEEMLGAVESALGRIAKGAFGICEACGEKINEKRLKANPAASTCVKHSKR